MLRLAMVRKIPVYDTDGIVQQFARKRTKTLAHVLVESSTHYYYNFNPCGRFKKMTSFTPIFNQGKVMAARN